LNSRWAEFFESAKLFCLDIVYSRMKTKIISVVSLIIIAILGASLVYEIVQKKQDAKYYKQFAIALDVQLYQGLERGDVEAVKQRLGRFVAANSLLYEQKYGHETDTKFAMRLSEAKSIRDEFQGTSK
jgi:hypothetical protein